MNATTMPVQTARKRGWSGCEQVNDEEPKTVVHKIRKRNQGHERLSDTEYRYDQLSDPEPYIRVLQLLPAENEDDDLHCTLHAMCLSHSPEDKYAYEALSYAWGDSQERRTVYLDGCLLYITVNLDAALRHLRYTSRNRRLWVDALCINQSDDREKSLQVAVMRHIYAKAYRVLVWLGAGDGDTDAAMDLFASVVEEPGHGHGPEETHTSRTARRVQAYRKHMVDPNMGFSGGCGGIKQPAGGVWPSANLSAGPGSQAT
ncbi:hypothetical protein PMZ80_006998 [Knufia obscura]|uniref:Heterokaryon incompatibility domain-containing protein n=2 Tax=Knufia TaxID=430999 RepID=A0AAN8FFF3_9EURO|nr:hypothetical protein PMZ80_006998 [Knufia obscura]KAK5957536.1 hypothetical protein OHC33_001912 [Knufia fluminis]